MDLVGYYKRFIGVLSRISYPITSLQRKCVKFEYTSKCEESFHCLKDLLTSALFINIVYPNANFLLYIYPCKEGLGGVLM